MIVGASSVSVLVGGFDVDNGIIVDFFLPALLQSDVLANNIAFFHSLFSIEPLLYNLKYLLPARCSNILYPIMDSKQSVQLPSL
jgi:hypothetical protein